MSELHVATSSKRSRELVKAVLDEFDRWAKHAASQAADLNPTDPEKAADEALYSVRTDMDDHLGVAIGVTLAAWELLDER